MFDPLLLDDFERFPYNWDASDNVTLSNPELTDADALARPGQDSFEGVLSYAGFTLNLMALLTVAVCAYVVVQTEPAFERSRCRTMASATSLFACVHVSMTLL